MNITFLPLSQNGQFRSEGQFFSWRENPGVDCPGNQTKKTKKVATFREAAVLEGGLDIFALPSHSKSFCASPFQKAEVLTVGRRCCVHALIPHAELQDLGKFKKRFGHQFETNSNTGDTRVGPMCSWFSWGNDLDLLLSPASVILFLCILSLPKVYRPKNIKLSAQSYTPVRPLAFASKCNWPLPIVSSLVSFACDMHEMLKHSTPNLWTQKKRVWSESWERLALDSTLRLKAFKGSKTGHQTPNSKLCSACCGWTNHNKCWSNSSSCKSKRRGLSCGDSSKGKFCWN